MAERIEIVVAVGRRTLVDTAGIVVAAELVDIAAGLAAGTASKALDMIGSFDCWEPRIAVEKRTAAGYKILDMMLDIMTGTAEVNWRWRCSTVGRC